MKPFSTCGCQILFVAEGESARTEEIIQFQNAASVLTISEAPDFARRGGMIALHHVQVACPPGGEDAARTFYADGLGLLEVEKPEEFKGGGTVQFSPMQTLRPLGWGCSLNFLGGRM